MAASVSWINEGRVPDPTDALDPRDTGDGFVMCPDCDNYSLRRHPKSGNPFAPRGYYRVPRCESCDREDGCYGETCEEQYDVDYWEERRRDMAWELEPCPFCVGEVMMEGGDR